MPIESDAHRACISPALRGCLALLRPGSAASISATAAAQIERTLLRELPIAALSHENRLTCLHVLQTILKVRKLARLTSILQAFQLLLAGGLAL